MSFLYNLRLKLFAHLAKKLSKVDDVEQTTDESFDPNEITQIEESLNDKNWGFKMYGDTTTLLPGIVLYVVCKIEPSNKIPYVTYKPEPRIVTSIHDSGINGGTVFLTYSHKIVHQQTISDSPQQNIRVVSEDEVIYSPLTEKHAEYICRLLNVQSEQLYKEKLAQILSKQK